MITECINPDCPFKDIDHVHAYSETYEIAEQLLNEGLWRHINVIPEYAALCVDGYWWGKT